MNSRGAVGQPRTPFAGGLPTQPGRRTEAVQQAETLLAAHPLHADPLIRERVIGARAATRRAGRRRAACAAGEQEPREPQEADGRQGELESPTGNVYACRTRTSWPTVLSGPCRHGVESLYGEPVPQDVNDEKKLMLMEELQGTAEDSRLSG